jgi:hypothetical protein
MQSAYRQPLKADLELPHMLSYINNYIIGYLAWLSRFRGVKSWVLIWASHKGYRQVMKEGIESPPMVSYGFLMHYKRLSCIVMEILKFKDIISLFGQDKKGIDKF